MLQPNVIAFNANETNKELFKSYKSKLNVGPSVYDVSVIFFEIFGILKMFGHRYIR